MSNTDRITAGELQTVGTVLQTIVEMSMLIEPDVLSRAINSAARAHAVMPILDPTAYQRDMQALAMHERSLRVFAVFRRELEEMKCDLEERPLPERRTR